jgi:hypothetical protein
VDVRERDDGSPGWGDLPGGLSFTEEEPLPPPPVRRSWAGRLLRWLLVLALLAAAAVVGLRWQGEQDVRDVLASSTATYTRVVEAVGDARDPEALASAAALAPRAVQRLDGDLGRLRPGDRGRRAAVRDQVEAEQAVLRALAPLERLADGPLGVWGRAHEPLADAVAEEGRTRIALGAVDAGAARALPDTAAAVRRLSAAVGSALVSDVQRSAGELLDDLAAAQRTADLREAAGRATGQRSAVAVAADGLGGADAAVLSEFAAALDAVRDLEQVTPADTAAWPGIRSRLSEHLRFVADSDDSLAAGSVRARLPLVLTAVDGLVARAAEAHAAWQPLHDAAVAQKASDAAALQRYATALRGTADEWSRLRSDVTALAGRRTTPTAGAVVELGVLATTGDRLLSALRTTAVPEGAGTAHAALVSSAEALTSTLATVLDELRDAECQDCPVSDDPGWRSLDRGASASSSWDTAFAAWERAVAEADAAVAAREPPPPPDA